jgi:integrase
MENLQTIQGRRQFLTTVVKSVHDGTYQDVKPALMKDVLDRWLTHSMEVRRKLGQLKPSTEKSYRSMVATHFQPAFGDYRSDQLSAAVIADWVKTKADDVDAGTVTKKTYNNLLNLLHAILAWARHPAQRYLAHDPLTGQKRLTLERPERDFLEDADITALLQAAGSTTNEAILHLALFGGLRRGEIFSLKWQDIDWGDGKRGGRVLVQRSIYQGAITAPKTATSERSVDVPQRLLDVLKRHQKECPPLEGDFVLRTTTGTPMDGDNFGKRILPEILTRAKLRSIGLHALRHTYTSLLIRQGENLKYVSKQLGHASIKLTADLYGHLFKETSTTAMRRLDKMIPVRQDETTKITAEKAKKNARLRIVA